MPVSPLALRLLVGVNLASLALNGVVAYSVLRRPRDAVSPELIKALATPRAAHRSGYTPFVREYQYVDKASGRLLGAVLADDSGKLEEFITEARLTADQEVDLRQRFARRHEREMEMAARMVKDGAWRHGDFLALYQEFWKAEYQALLPEQRFNLSAQFFPGK